MDVSVDTKMWLIFIVVKNVTERVKLMWTCGLEYTHVPFYVLYHVNVLLLLIKRYNLHVNITVFKLHYCSSFTKLGLSPTAIVMSLHAVQRWYCGGVCIVHNMIGIELTVRLQLL
jgi:hypothetical protein